MYMCAWPSGPALFLFGGRRSGGSSETDGATTGAKARLILGRLRGAEAPLFHGTTGITALQAFTALQALTALQAFTALWVFRAIRSLRRYRRSGRYTVYDATGVQGTVGVHGAGGFGERRRVCEQRLYDESLGKREL